MKESITHFTLNTMQQTKSLISGEDKGIEKAIKLLDLLVRPSTRYILEFLHENREGTYVDILVHCGENDLEDDLRDLVSAGILNCREELYSPVYRLNLIKLFRVRKAALFMTTSPEDASQLNKRVSISANL